MQINKEGLIKLEEKILNFWRANNIFKLTLEKNKNNKRFNFLEGPPYANASPHMGHFLNRIYKDVILRFRTMIGEYVPRFAGWDTHGLPIEVATEKELGIKNKKEIINYGIDKFNKKCKELVMASKDEFEYMDDRMGLWIDHQNAYVTYDPFYMESCWWIIKKIYEKGFLKEEYRVFPYCPRCETVISQAEVGQIDAYKKVLDPNIYVKFKLKDREEYFLVWTTTPWTLISNLALAIHPEYKYFLYEIDNEKIWAIEGIDERLKKLLKKDIKILDEKIGKEFEGIRYEPLYKLTDDEKSYKVYLADFVKKEEGTGIVHIAPAFGEEDFELGKENNLPLINPINISGLFDIKEDLDIKDKINGLFFKDADKFILEDLKNKNLVLYGKLNDYEHEYPHCWRCKTPLIYYSTKNWVIKVSRIRNRLIKENEKVNWIPKEFGNRFYEWIKEGKDWNLSRTRFWGIPLPIWRCNKCGSIEVIGSLKDLGSKFKSKNRYIFLRHGEAISNRKNLISSYPEKFFNPLTENGIKKIEEVVKKIKKYKIDLIISSPLLRTLETARIISEKLNIPIITDFRLREIDFGTLNGKKVSDYHNFTGSIYEKYFRTPPEGENLEDVKKRMISVILDLEDKYEGKNILIVSHELPLRVLFGEMLALSKREVEKRNDLKLEPGELKEVEFLVLPRDENNEINIHRPYVDKFKWKCKCGGIKERIEELVDIWFDSGSAPFSVYHYPFENEKEMEKLYPIDFILEGLDQTRGWFYTLFVIGLLIKGEAPYKNVMSYGLVLDKAGRKMSKSLGNVADPIKEMEKYGADLLRLYFLTLSDPIENKKYEEESLLSLKTNFFDLIFNILNFYRMYYVREKNRFKKPKKELLIDKWFDIRVKETYKILYESLLLYNPTKPSREIFNLVQDLSHWWLRRSRKRFQRPQNKQELIDALLKLEEYLFNISKFLAPFTPFFSEYLYQEIKNEVKNRFKTQLSVHLERFEKQKDLTKKEKEILENMRLAREIASILLMLRKTNGIKVRQPLKDAYIGRKLDPEYLELVKEEANVKDIFIGEPKNKEDYFENRKGIYVWLNKNITPELKEEGIINDFIRYIQDLRQDLDLIPQKKAIVSVEANKNLEEILRKDKKTIIKNTNLIDISFSKPKSFSIKKEFNYEDFGKVVLYLNIQ
ncbi:MAG: class I tRNA ligase family protein [Minisyncoccia bacterium]